ncbi:hypothetical protein BG000_001194 [Podila horticola]|nr:hypothetical protein BG000_001194 [Podila horticola]
MHAAHKNFIVVFKAKNGNRIGVWADQRVFARYAKFASLLDSLPSVSSHSSAGGHRRVKAMTVRNSSLESYCALIGYIYTGESKASGSFAEQEEVASSSECYVAREVAQKMNPSTTWKDLFLAADVYEIESLRRVCRDKTMTYLKPDLVLAGLFDYGYQYTDLRKLMVVYVVQHKCETTDRYGQDESEVFEDHPECEAIRAEVATEAAIEAGQV